MLREAVRRAEQRVPPPPRPPPAVPPPVPRPPGRAFATTAQSSSAGAPRCTGCVPGTCGAGAPRRGAIRTVVLFLAAAGGARRRRRWVWRRGGRVVTGSHR